MKTLNQMLLFTVCLWIIMAILFIAFDYGQAKQEAYVNSGSIESENELEKY